MRVGFLGLWLFSAALPADFSAREVEYGFIRLDNGDRIRVSVAPEQGGELSAFSVRIGAKWHELVYRANDYADTPGWRGKAMLLWPAAGVSLASGGARNAWRLDGRVYDMPGHGFVRAMAWRVVDAEAHSDQAYVTLECLSDDRSRERYPFDFRLEVTYRLLGDRLSLEYAVFASAANVAPMPFSIGNHITFNAPLLEGSQAEDLQFRTDLPSRYLRDANKVFSGGVRESPFAGWQTLAALPRRDAVSLGGRPGTALIEIRDPSGFQLAISHRASLEPTEPAIRFNLWADAEEGFFSPEPWIAMQNSLNSGLGRVNLSPGQTWRWTIDIVPVLNTDNADPQTGNPS